MQLEARNTTQKGAMANKQFTRTVSTILNLEKRRLKAKRSLPEDIGKHPRTVDTAILSSLGGKKYVARRRYHNITEYTTVYYNISVYT